MTDKKQVFLSLETARKMYNSKCIDLGSDFKNDCLLAFLLDNFTKEELEAKELPKSWEELNVINGYYVQSFINHRNNQEDKISFINCYAKDGYKNTFPTKELAEASLALAQLLQLRDVYNGNWKVDLNNRPNERKFIIRNRFNGVECNFSEIAYNYILSFEKESIRDKFLENFKDLITTALPLL